MAGLLAARVLGEPYASVTLVNRDLLASAGDLRFPGVDGRRTPKVRAVNAYLERLHVAAEHDPVVGRAFLRVVNLLDRPGRLLAPALVLRVLRGVAHRRR
jgi:hypothetical protein